MGDTLRWRRGTPQLCNDCDICQEKKDDLTFEVTGTPRAILALWPFLLEAHNKGENKLELLEVIDSHGIRLSLVGDGR